MLLPELIEIPGGTFVMGDIWGDGDPDETPTVAVHLGRLLLGRYPVTTVQFATFLEECGSEAEIRACIDIATPGNLLSIVGGNIACATGYERYPVTYVSWLGAIRYCAWLTEKLGIPCRLPSEAEWQNASMGRSA